MSETMIVYNEEDIADAALTKVVSTLYCLSVANDFRKPVEVLYPNISSSYLSKVKQPMDLGM